MNTTKAKKNVLSMISAAISVLYTFFILKTFIGGMTNASSDAEMIGVGLAGVLLLPHLVMVFLATIFNLIGAFTKLKGLIIVAGIMYIIAMFFFLPYFPFVIFQAILCFVAHYQIKNQENVYVNVKNIE